MHIKTKNSKLMDLPYLLNLNFTEPAHVDPLIGLFAAQGLICLGEEQIDAEFSIIHFHFKNDPEKYTVLHMEIEGDNCERINISISYGTHLNIIKELFSFLNTFDSSKITLVDQQIKTALYLKDVSTFASNAESTSISEEWLNSTEKQAVLTLSFSDFYNNATGLVKREELLGKMTRPR
jgi:hypothetical protein